MVVAGRQGRVAQVGHAIKAAASRDPVGGRATRAAAARDSLLDVSLKLAQI